MSRIPTYRRHKASGQAVVTIRGKSFYLGTFVDGEKQASSSSYREYQRLIVEWQDTGRLPSPAARELRQPAYRRHKASGQAVVRICGKEVYLGRYGTAASKQAYRTLMAEWQASGATTAAFLLVKDLTVVEVLVAYLKYAKAYYGAQRDSDTTTASLPLNE